jgi:hypothetical protein
MWSTLQRQNTEILKQIFPEKEYLGLSPNFHLKCVCERFIYSHDRHGNFAGGNTVCRPILGLYKSLTDTRMLKLGLRPRYSQKKNKKWDFRCIVAELMYLRGWLGSIEQIKQLC